MSLPFVVVELTGACNLSCRYCYNHWRRPGESSPARSSYARAMRLLRRLHKVAAPSHVTLSGGEPFLVPRLLELALFCRLKGARVNIITNGNTASDDDLSAAQGLGIDLFELPLHAPDAGVHDQMTGREGSHARSRHSIERLIGQGQGVAASIVVTRLNARLVGRTLEVLRDIGVQRVMVNRFNLGGRGLAEADALLPDRDDLVTAFSQAAEGATRHGMKISSGVCTPYCLVDPARFAPVRFGACRPGLDMRPLAVDLEGQLRYCNHSPVVFGNLFSDRLADIESSSYLRQWAQPPAFCTDCALFERCRGGCRAASEQLGLGLDAVDPVLSRLGVRAPPSCAGPSSAVASSA